MADVLISHVNEDHIVVSQLAHILEEIGWSVWWNQNIPPGHPVDFATEAELVKALVVVTVWSRRSVNSRLVRNTAYEAIDSGCWLPVRIERIKLPLRCRDFNTLDMLDRSPAAAATAGQRLSEYLKPILEIARHAPPYESATSAPVHAWGADAAGTDSDQSGHFDEAAQEIVEAGAGEPEFVSLYLGDWLVDEGQNRIRRGTETKRLTPRSMQVLCLLLKSGQAPISIGRILAEVWQDRVVVESVVHRCISEVREALGDNFREPRYIETIAKKGYRVVAAIKSNE
ncbi:MAG: winged helix-turn-helix domain-containing protein [Pseudomonadales bacterium]